MELVAARADGALMMQRTSRSDTGLTVPTTRLMRFFQSPLRRSRRHERGEFPVDVAPIVFSWLAGRGAEATRLDPARLADTAASLLHASRRCLAGEQLFFERVDQRRIVASRTGVARGAWAPGRGRSPVVNPRFRSTLTRALSSAFG